MNGLEWLALASARPDKKDVQDATLSWGWQDGEISYATDSHRLHAVWQSFGVPPIPFQHSIKIGSLSNATVPNFVSVVQQVATQPYIAKCPLNALQASLCNVAFIARLDDYRVWLEWGDGRIVVSAYTRMFGGISKALPAQTVGTYASYANINYLLDALSGVIGVPTLYTKGVGQPLLIGTYGERLAAIMPMRNVGAIPEDRTAFRKSLHYALLTSVKGYGKPKLTRRGSEGVICIDVTAEHHFTIEPHPAGIQLYWNAPQIRQLIAQATGQYEQKHIDLMVMQEAKTFR